MKRHRRHPRTAQRNIDRRLLADVEQLAEASAETIVRLHKAGLGDVAQPLEAALQRLAGCSTGRAGTRSDAGARHLPRPWRFCFSACR